MLKEQNQGIGGNQIVNNTDFGKINIEMQSHLKKGRDDSWLADHYGFTLQLVWAME